jgi:hypothetical protein
MPWSTKLDFPINKLKVNNPVNFINKFVCFFGDLIEFFVALRLCSFLCLIVGHLVLELMHFTTPCICVWCQNLFY